MRHTAGLYKALGDETRLHMLWLLMNHRELCVCDLMEVLQITQSKASRHLPYPRPRTSRSPKKKRSPKSKTTR